MKRCVLISLALFAVLSLRAQVQDDMDERMKKAQQDAKNEFEAFVNQAKKDFDDFRRQANEEYARFMEEAWKSFDLMDAEELPRQPQPVMLYENEVRETNDRIEYDILEVDASDIPADRTPRVKPFIEEDLEQARPEPMEPIMTTFESDALMQSLVFYGSEIQYRAEPVAKQPASVSLKNLSEKSVARMWRKLSCPYYDNIVAECLRQRTERKLCDWAYVKLTEQMASKYFGKDTNEAVVLQLYLLVQSGYQMRIAKAGNKLTLLMGSKEKIYRYKYFIKDGVKYYTLDRKMQNRSMLVFDHAFPKEKTLSLKLSQPDLQVVKTEQRTITSYLYPNVSVTVQTNRNLIDFYDEYPQCGKWDYYSLASMSDVLKETLYPYFRTVIEGKTELEAANIMLNWVQTGLNYESDFDQFGYERPLYPDEVFFYPSCDCEDRSILFSCMVRELLGLDVVLLDYPTHISTAVCFNGDVRGDYVELNGKKYVICEPTITGAGAPVGVPLSKYKGVKPKLVQF